MPTSEPHIPSKLGQFSFGEDSKPAEQGQKSFRFFPDPYE
jgi:hypothetical protein